MSLKSIIKNEFKKEIRIRLGLKHPKKYWKIKGTATPCLKPKYECFGCGSRGCG